MLGHTESLTNFSILCQLDLAHAKYLFLSGVKILVSKMKTLLDSKSSHFFAPSIIALLPAVPGELLPGSRQTGPKRPQQLHPSGVDIQLCPTSCRGQAGRHLSC